MPTYSKLKFSASTSGRPIKVVSTTQGAGTLIHQTHATALDEIHLWAVNTDSADRLLTIEFGGTTDPDDQIPFTVPTLDGLYLIIPGWTLTGTLDIDAFAAAANVIIVGGFVNRITA